MAHFDRAIPPGGEGKITLKVDTKGYQGEVHKRAKVYTNDPRKKIEVLTIQAVVKAAISLSPRTVHLKGPMGQKVTKTVEIRAERDKPLNLEPTHFDLSKQVNYSIEEVEAGKLFRVHFTNIPGPNSAYQGLLKLKTNYPEKPEITIRIKGRFRKVSKI